MRSHGVKTCCFLVLSLFVGISTSLAQESETTPIYLDEPDPEPTPKIARRDSVEEQYDDETLRSERGVAYLSDGQVVNHGKYVEYYRDGQKYAEGAFEFGMFVGKWQYWYPNGQLCKVVTFKAGKPDGRWEIFRPDGSRESVKQFSDGKRDGTWISYFEDGEQQKVELHYKGGRFEGDRKTYYPNGQLRQQIPFQDGVMHGTMTNWDESGQKTSEMTLEKGKPAEKGVSPGEGAESAEPGA